MSVVHVTTINHMDPCDLGHSLCHVGVCHQGHNNLGDLHYHQCNGDIWDQAVAKVHIWIGGSAASWVCVDVHHVLSSSQVAIGTICVEVREPC